MKKTKKSTKNHNHSHFEDHSHSSHGEAITRLKRAGGHLTSVIKMIEDHRPCAEILQQLTAVISALGSTRVLLLQDHIDSCINPLLKADQKHLLEELQVVIQRSMKV